MARVRTKRKKTIALVARGGCSWTSPRAIKSFCQTLARISFHGLSEWRTQFPLALILAGMVQDSGCNIAAKWNEARLYR
jgi:hypothetical protein